MDITAVGEILVDLTQTGNDGSNIGQFAANPGGAPANVAVAAAKLGAKTAFVGKIGRDAFGLGLKRTLMENQVDCSGLCEDRAVPTSLAVVTVDGTGERSFSFYRSPGADVMLEKEEIPETLLKMTRFLHFGSVSLTADPARTATLYAARRAKELGAILTYDPNYRPALWTSEDLAKAEMRVPLTMVDILKISDEELELMTGTTDPAEGAARMQEKGIRLVLVTLGADGVYYRFGTETGTVPGFSVQVADTNGAGDTFFGAVLSRLSRRETAPWDMTRTELEDILRFANKAASITTSRSGAIPAMPSLNELQDM